MTAQAPDPEATVATWKVATRHGGALVIAVGVVGGLFAVAWVVSLVGGAPPSIERFVWVFAVLGFVLLAVAVALQQRRRRTLSLVRRRAGAKLVVDGVELGFPLALRGSQIAAPVERLVMHHVTLQCVDGSGRAAFFHEVRGAAYGPHEDWIERPLDPSHPGPRFDIGGVTQLEELRRQIEALNAEIANGEAPPPKKRKRRGAD